MKLYGYFRSSAAHRVRIALALKGLEFDLETIHLRKDEQKRTDYVALNPQGFLPTLIDTEQPLFQSLAIIEYLEEAYPEPRLIPFTLDEKARVRAISQMVACDIHPLNNLRVRRYLTEKLGHSDDQVADWTQHWMLEGFAAIETLLARDSWTGEFCHGDNPTMADACLIPQVNNARRSDIDLSPYPTILRIAEACEALPAFQKAAPESQPDYEAA